MKRNISQMGFPKGLSQLKYLRGVNVCAPLLKPRTFLDCTLRKHQGTIAAAKIGQNIEFAAFLVCVFEEEKKVYPVSWCNKLSFKKTLICIFIVDEKFIWTEIWKNQEALIHFLKGQDARHGSSECPPAQN